MSNTKWVVGIDPGFGGTGAVLRLMDSQTVVQSAIWRNDETHDWPVRRAMSICIPMMETMLNWLMAHDIRHLEVCLESPIYNGNPKVLMIQMSLFVMIQSYVYDYLVPHVDTLYLSIINNKTSKSKLAHNGNATKAQMIAVSPWANFKKQGLAYWQAHTLADAYAHSLSGRTEEYALHALPQYIAPEEGGSSE